MYLDINLMEPYAKPQMLGKLLQVALKATVNLVVGKLILRSRPTVY